MSKKMLEGQVAIITGAGGKAMGRSHAMLLAAYGCAVVVNDIFKDGAEAVAEEIRSLGGKVIASSHDCSDPAQAEDLVKTTLDAFGGLHIVVANAAACVITSFMDATYDNFMLMEKANVHGPFNLMKAAWPHLIGQKYGRVILVSSGAGILGDAGEPVYAGTKAFSVGLGRALALEGEPHGVYTNVLLPGAVSPLWGEMSEEEIAEYRKHYDPAFVSPTVLYLVRPECKINNRMVYSSCGNVGLVNITYTKGYWDPAITFEKMMENEKEMLDESDQTVIKDTLELMKFNEQRWGAEMSADNINDLYK